MGAKWRMPAPWQLQRCSRHSADAPQVTCAFCAHTTVLSAGLCKAVSLPAPGHTSCSVGTTADTSLILGITHLGCRAETNLRPSQVIRTRRFTISLGGDSSRTAALTVRILTTRKEISPLSSLHCIPSHSQVLTTSVKGLWSMVVLSCALHR